MAAPQLSIGQFFGRYRVLELIGKGGMGLVFRAHDDRLNRDVAVKVLASGALEDEAARKRFEAEAQWLSTLNHPNIAAVYDFGTHDGADFIVMELVEGETVAQQLQTRRFSQSEIVSIAIQVASGLEEAHEHNIVHRDLKPGNVVMTAKGQVKLLDFGLAKKWRVGPQDSTALAGKVEVAGTFPYMAPEQLRGHAIDPRSDLWALGVMLYEMCARRLPFQSENLADLVEAIMRQQPQPIHDLRPTVTPAFEELVGRALDKDPARRFQSAAEFREALEQLRDSGSVPPSSRALAQTQGPIREPLIGVEKRPIFYVPLLLVVIAASLLGIKPIRERFFPTKPVLPQKKLVAVLPFKIIGNDAEMSAFSDGLTETLSSKLGQFTEKHALQVIPTRELRNSASTTTEKVRSAFGVNLVIEGSMQKVGSQVRINCQLVDAATHHMIQGDTITAPAGDSFALEDEVVNGVLKLLEIDLASDERQLLQKYGTTNSDAHEYYLRARGYMQDYHKEENIAAALASYKRAIQLDPSYALAYAGMGEAYWRTFQQSHNKAAVDQGISACNQAIKLADQASEGHFCLGRMLDLTGHPEEAIKQFELAVVLDPNSDEAYRGLAQAYSSIGMPQKAEATYQRAISMRPQYWAGYSWLGWFYFQQARYDDAVKMFEKVLEFSPDNFRAYSNLGAIHVMKGDYQQAIAELQRSIALRPTVDGYTNLGGAYFGLRKFAEAAQTYEEGLKLDQKSYTLWGNLGDARYWSPELRRKADEAYNTAIEMAGKKVAVTPRDAETLALLASYYSMTGNRTAALSNLNRSLALSPNNAQVLYEAALVHVHFGDNASALRYLGKAAGAGYPFKSMYDDPNFDGLHNRIEFENLKSAAESK
jgi:serine/threonine protein kinase/tetratricopeptide (TPR) repeat protein